MAQRLIKINLKDRNCKGLYLVDNEGLFGCTEITDDIAPKGKRAYKLVLRTTAIRAGKSVTAKETFSFTDMTLKNAVDAVSAQRSSLQEKIANPVSKTSIKKQETFDSAWKRYIEEKKLILSASNITNQESIYRKHLEPILRDALVHDVTTEDLQAIVNTLLKRGSKPRTAKSIMDYTRPFFKWAKIKPNPAEDIHIPSLANEVHFSLEPEKAKALIEAMRNYHDMKIRGIFTFLLSGRRLNEVLSLQHSEIDREKGEYTILPSSNKSKRTMKHRLRSEMLEVIQLPKTSQYIFPAYGSDKKMSQSTFRKHWIKLLKQVGIEEMRIHDIRHLIGGTLVDAGLSLEQVASVLGHSSTAVTKRYSKVSQTTASNALDKFDEVMR